MGRDLRELLKEDTGSKKQMREGHEERFLEKLDLAQKSPAQGRKFWWPVAASVVVLLGLGILFFPMEDRVVSEEQPVVLEEQPVQTNQAISLGDLSPDLEKLENFYLASINMELAELEISEENQVMVSEYMDRLATLNDAYKELQKELNELGPNDQTIEALIYNLQMRLDLLYKLRDKINYLKSSKNETVTSHSI
ncbi:hypothetical protein [Zeaxanthinibacter enoshimensis]|uniref:Uncharacterized protein n=1 Tax=Zeaxanthinibacter enoshimensis TaxID=392009 RepID=A0A4R6TGR5_9FLAO|nr:hypothetical protein [Zeaxanthinibacter enoshimensis]TDQ29268.1 hypothetical protein CLV82_2723 [Zeaxanthinibacter enoshimensis]